MNKKIDMVIELLELIKAINEEFSKGGQIVVNIDFFGQLDEALINSMKSIASDNNNHVETVNNDYWYLLVASYVAGQISKDEVVNSFMNINKVGAMVH